MKRNAVTVYGFVLGCELVRWTRGGGVGVSAFEVPSSGCDRSNGAGPSTTEEAHASRVYSFLCTQALTWKTEYTRDAYATVPGDFRVSIAEAAQNPEL